MEKLLPQDVDAERAVLGSCIDAPAAFDSIAPLLRPEHFYIEAHRTVYQAMLDLRTQGKPPDMILLHAEMERTGKLDNLNAGPGLDGWAYVSSLVNYSNPVIAPHYAQLVADAALAREAIHQAGDLAAAAYDNPKAAAILDEMEKAAARIRDSYRAPDGGRFKLHTIDELANRPPLQWLEHRVFRERSLAMIFAQWGVGKTYMALWYAVRWARDKGHVIWICAEGADFIYPRIKTLMETLGMDELPRLHIISEAANLLDAGEVAEVIANAKAIGEPITAVFVDTLACSMPGANENAPEDMGAAVDALKRIQRELDCFVCAIHHPGKDESRGGRGHSSLPGALDTALELSRDGEDDVITVHCYKQRGAIEFPDFYVRLKLISLTDADGNLTGETERVIEPLDREETAEAKAKSRKPLAKRQQELLDALNRFPDGRATYKDWRQVCSYITKASFNSARTALVSAKPPLVKQYGAYYISLVCNESHTGMNTPPHTGMNGMTPLKRVIPSYQGRIPDPACPICGGNDGRDYGDGFPRCLRCDVPLKGGGAA